MSAKLAYADASALTKLCVEEPESEALAAFLSGSEVVITLAITRVEVGRALRRAGGGDETVEAMRRLLGAVRLRAVTDDLLERAESLEPPTLRTLDALHLASALDLGPALDAFVCYDGRLAAAARLHGLPVVAPAAGEVHEP